MIRDWYFTVLVEVSINHIFLESYRVNKTQNYGLQTCKYQIIWRCLNFKNIPIDDFKVHSFHI